MGKLWLRKAAGLIGFLHLQLCVCVGGWVQETGKDLNRITKRVLPVFEEASLSAVACSILEPCVFDFQ